ncbi:MAG: hypothetical protein AB8G99_14385, partial [Planctomycetaceae bacterium]
ENQFPNPARIMRGLTSKFDFAISLNLDSVPPAMRKLALGFISAQANADLQQRDDEPDGVYKMRRAQQERGLEAITQILEQLERLVIGIDVDKENSQAALEIVFDAQEDSQLAKDMKQVNKKRSHFERLVQEEAPLSFSMSAPIIERDQQQYREMLDGLELWLPTVLNKGSDETTLNPAITAGIQALRDTVAEAHTDMFLQFYGAPGSFSIVGGGRVVGGQKINAGVKEVLMQFSDDINNEVGEIDFDHETYKDVVFHRMVARDADDAARVFGDEIGIYLGVGRRTAWLAVGGSDALDKTKELIDLLAEPKDGNRTRVRRGPFQLVVNAKQWLGLDDDGEGVQFDAFEDGGDRMTIDIRPTESGMRVRAQVDEGYLRLIGMAAGQRYDRRNERRARRGNRGGQPSGSRD